MRAVRGIMRGRLRGWIVRVFIGGRGNQGPVPAPTPPAPLNLFMNVKVGGEGGGGRGRLCFTRRRARRAIFVCFRPVDGCGCCDECVSDGSEGE